MHTTHLDYVTQCAIDVHRQLGSDLNECVYEKALVLELQAIHPDVWCETQVALPLYLNTSDGRRHFITSLRLDIIIHDNSGKTLVELKANKAIHDRDVLQLVRYVELYNKQHVLSPITHAMVINFGASVNVREVQV